jgi:hypothetical protein
MIGTRNRNHCPHCLWSKHVDKNPGDREAQCGKGMEPIGLTFKHEGTDKYGQPRQGELMIVHRCTEDGKISINRIAGDDNPERILEIFHKSPTLDENIKNELKKIGIDLLDSKDEAEIKLQLFGKKDYDG